MKRLEGKVGIVFGAGPNIGGTIAHFMAREGARLVVGDLKLGVAEETVAFLKSRGYDATAVAVDATDEDEVQGAVSLAVSRYGRVDIAVNMAGKPLWGSVTELDVAEWSLAVLSFPTAAMLTTKHVAQAMMTLSFDGSIIHVLSTAAHFGEAGAAAYAAAKAATLNFARSAAMDLAPAGIRVNTITPCSLEHQLWTMMRDQVDSAYQEPDRYSFYSRDDYLKNIPLGRFPRSSDLAWAAVFLASDESRILTGVDIPVDGGLRHKYPTWRPGDHTGVNIKDYVKNLQIEAYGEETNRTL